jgi:hypothetical protein
MRTTILDKRDTPTRTQISDLTYELSSGAMITTTQTLVGVVSRPSDLLYSWRMYDDGHIKAFSPPKLFKWRLSEYIADCERVQLTVATDGGRLLVYAEIRDVMGLPEAMPQVWWADPLNAASHHAAQYGTDRATEVLEYRL